MPQPLYLAGLLGDGDVVVPVSVADADGAAYVAGSDVLRLADGSLRYVPPGHDDAVTVPPGDVGAAESAGRGREWLASGEVPGRIGVELDAAARALLDLRLLTLSSGAVAAGWHGSWRYSWPRDASWACAALASTGHLDEARAILGFLARTQRDDGTWEARVLLDGSGPPDDRPRQLDANGWVPWAAWVYAGVVGELDGRAYRMVVHACDHVAATLGRDGLPPVTPDYWETRTRRHTIGVAAPLLAGLRAGVVLAGVEGRSAHAARWADAAARLDEGVEGAFAATGYHRTPDPGSGADAAVTFLAPPFAPGRPDVADAVLDARKRLTRRNGGVVPGEDWTGTDSWTPETGFFALAAAASGRYDEASETIAWLTSHRTSLGALPEKVTQDGAPASVAPLAWTAAILVLALLARDQGLPVPQGSAADDS
ncbi:MAG: glycoside hydrolase family 15 [Streptosporangiales bacterium]|nr:glycoside hydrolase family 15 [Streptosporangiales bacterium]